MPFAEKLEHKRNYHNGRLREYRQQHSVPHVDIHSCLWDEHFGDELHPNRLGAEIIAREVFAVLRGIV